MRRLDRRRGGRAVDGDEAAAARAAHGRTVEPARNTDPGPAGAGDDPVIGARADHVARPAVLADALGGLDRRRPTRVAPDLDRARLGQPGARWDDGTAGHPPKGDFVLGEATVAPDR